MGGCCRWDWLVRPGDTPDEVRIKTLVFPFALIMLLAVSFIAINRLLSHNQMVAVIGNAVVAGSFLLFTVGVLSNMIRAGHLLDMSLAGITLGICAMDLSNATMSYSFRSWTVMVVFLDIALVFKRFHMPHFIIPSVVVYLAALQ
eukprot:Hpha_TRINITY_DN15648_c2_g2::TRINITY_DN15648_c2_g2_i1::g.99758::m.99758